VATTSAPNPGAKDFFVGELPPGDHLFELEQLGGRVVFGKALGDLFQLVPEKLERPAKLGGLDDLEERPGTVFHVEAEFPQGRRFGGPKPPSDQTLVPGLEVKVGSQPGGLFAAGVEDAAEVGLVRGLFSAEPDVPVDAVEPKRRLVAPPVDAQGGKQVEDEALHGLPGPVVLVPVGLKPRSIVVQSQRGQEWEHRGKITTHGW